MSIEQRIFRGQFAPSEFVILRQYCFTPGCVFPPGTYLAGELPASAFEMALVEALPPVRGKSAEIKRQQPVEPSQNSEA